MKTFLDVISMFFVGSSNESSRYQHQIDELTRQITELRATVTMQAEELLRMQDIISLLVMTNAHIRVAGLSNNSLSDEYNALSGSLDGSGRLLN